MEAIENGVLLATYTLRCDQIQGIMMTLMALQYDVFMEHPDSKHYVPSNVHSVSQHVYYKDCIYTQCWGFTF